LNLCIVEQLTFKEISEKLKLPKEILTIWYDELKADRIAIATIRTSTPGWRLAR
jgi:hypothetical protein